MSLRAASSSRARARLASALAPLVALGATLATLRFLVPARLEAADDHALLTGVGLFVLFLEVARYWWRQRDPSIDQAAPEASLSLGRVAISIAVLAVIASVARVRFVEISRVASASMTPTLNVGDRLLVNKVAYGLRLPWAKRAPVAGPRRGDLIVFPNPAVSGSDREPASLVKRVLGLPGDEIWFLDGGPVINGWVVPSCDVGPFLSTDGGSFSRGRLVVELVEDRAYLTLRLPLDDRHAARFKVPPGQLYVLGDNRVASRDSRSWNEGRGGGVPIDAVEGRVSRLAAAARHDGSLDLGHPFAGLRPKLRESGVDVRQLERRIEGCLTHPPRTSRPPG